MEIHIPQWIVHSFEAAFGVFLFISGIATMLSWVVLDAFEQVIPYWQLVAFNSCYSLAGLLMVIGLVVSRGNIEASGLTLLFPLLIIRAILYGQLLGWGTDSVLSLLFSLVFASACVGRVYVILRT